MANKKFWLGMLVMALVFGMAVVGCDNGSTSSGGGGNAPSTSGRLTITGLDDYNGNYVYANGYVHAQDIFLLAAENINWTRDIYIGGKISNGSVTLKVWQVVETADEEEIVAYSGNHQNVEVAIAIITKATFSLDNVIARGEEMNVNFSNGVGSVVCENITPEE